MISTSVLLTSRGSLAYFMIQLSVVKIFLVSTAAIPLLVPKVHRPRRPRSQPFRLPEQPMKRVPPNATSWSRVVLKILENIS